MTVHPHLVLASVVPRPEWRNSCHDVLRAAHETLHQRARQQGLGLVQEPEETVEVLPGDTRVRITLRAKGVLLEPPVPADRSRTPQQD
ncbi:hypothetical protein ACFQ46_13795 [Kineococcus sp. GCM10028916]